MKKIINANNLEYLKTLEDNSIDSVVTDPPYGISFMNKKWDYDVPSVEFWTEVYRVLKPGGHVLSFGGTRTFHRLTVNIEDAGFDIRDTIVWHYGQGFPKSHNINKNLNKKFEASNEWEGWGTALKPATELITLAQKPISEKTIVENVMKWGTGALNIDGTRISTDEKNYFNTNGEKTNSIEDKIFKVPNLIKRGGGHEEGRWPANLILSHHPECIETDEYITLNEGKDNKEKILKNTKPDTSKEMDYRMLRSDNKNVISYGEEKIKKYNCHPDCPLKLMDDQSGYSKSVINDRGKRKFFKTSNWVAQTITKGHSDEGGASRFFYCPKPSAKEKQEGNIHPTVKPIKLMEYLIKMITPPNGIVLDPFAGSGTTGIAAKNLNFNYLLIEREEEYYNIIKNRLNDEKESTNENDNQ